MGVTSLQEQIRRKSAQTAAMPHWEPEDGSDPMTWGTFLGHHRDSDALDDSNWQVITGDMRSRFPEDVELVRFGHWGVGWIEEMFVRMTRGGKPTPAFTAAAEWQERLDDYPIADEDHYSQLQSERGEEI